MKKKNRTPDLLPYFWDAKLNSEHPYLLRILAEDIRKSAPKEFKNNKKIKEAIKNCEIKVEFRTTFILKRELTPKEE